MIDTPGGHDDAYRLLKYDGHVGDAERSVLLVAANVLWDDLLEWAARANDPAQADLIGLLPPRFHHRAAPDWQRWMATFAAVLGKLAQPNPPPPTTMAEQVVLAALTSYARDVAVDWYHGGLVDQGQPPDPQRFDDWLARHLEDADHEALYDPALDGLDDEATGFQAGLGRMDYEGMFADFHELGRPWRGSPHPLAPLHMSEAEAAEEDHVRRAANELAAPVARAALAGEDTVHPGVVPPNPPVTAFRVSQRLSVWLEWDAHAAVFRLRDFGDSDWLALWLDANVD